MNDIEMNDHKILNGKKQSRRRSSDYYHYYETEDEEEVQDKRKSVLSETEEDLDNGKEEKTTKEKEEEAPSVPYWKLYKFATFLDWILIIIATLLTVAIGACQTYYCVTFGLVTEDFISYLVTMEGANVTEAEAVELKEKLYSDIFIFSMKSVGLGVISFVFQYIGGVLLWYTSLRQVFKLRQKFFEKMMNQDISWYDLNKTGDFASTFSDNLAKIEEGIGEKVGAYVYYKSIAVSGVVWSIVLGWKLALVCLVSLPLSTFVMGVITWLSTKFSQQEMESYSQAGIIAEEVFSAIRTVVAFDGQKKEMKRYDEHLVNAKTNNIKRNLFSGISNGFLWFFVYACCALSMWYGVGLIIEEKNLSPEEKTYTPGVVIANLQNRTKRKAFEDISQRRSKIISTGLREYSTQVNFTTQDLADIRKRVYRSRRSILPVLPRSLQGVQEALKSVN